MGIRQTDAIADAAVSTEGNSAAYGLEPAAQEMDIIIQIAVLDVRIHSPYLCQQLFPCKDLARIAEKGLEELVFLFGQAA